MLLNHFKFAFRKLLKYRDYSLLNVLGLGLSVGCCILIFSFVRKHTQYDNYHPQLDRLMRIVMDVKTDTEFPFSGSPTAMPKALKEECPLVDQVAMISGEGETLISIPNAANGYDKYKDKKKFFAWVQPEYFDLLQYTVLNGSLAGLKEPNTVVITDNLARKYFKTGDPLGKTIRIENETDLRVVAVLADLPRNTDYQYEIMGSWATLNGIPRYAKDLDSWSGARGENYCFARLKPGVTHEAMNQFMIGMRKTHPHPDAADLFQYKAIAFAGLHFDTDYGFSMNKNHLLALGLIGLFLLITACVNFVNMATAQALTRAREVGVRKSLGSTRSQLFWQFIMETSLIVLISVLVGFVLARLALPYMNLWLDENIVFDRPLLINLTGFSVVTGLVLTFLAGFYPGWIQARFNPVISMKGATQTGKSGDFNLRRVLVTTQFAISQMLIIGAAVVTAQIHFAQEVDWGFRPGVTLTVNIPDSEKAQTLQQQIAHIAGVEKVSLCYQPPAAESNNHTGLIYDNRPDPEPWLLNTKPADPQYLETFGLDLLAGRNLQDGDTMREVVVNEAFMKKLNLSNPDELLNKTIRLGKNTVPIVGIVRDFHTWQLADAIPAVAFYTNKREYETCAVLLQPGNPAAAMQQIKQAWETQFPNSYFEAQFMDERVGEFVKTETMIMRLVRTFAGIAIFIGCLGLYGLSAFMIVRKRKEVGVRKTLGASVSGMVWLFGKEYLRLILIAFLIAAPMAWWAMNAWLNGYVYRVGFGTGIFAISLAVTALIAATTIGWQTIRAALANPVNALRD